MKILSQLLLIQFKEPTVKPSPVLFIQPTGGGKSLIRNVYSCIFLGVMLIIVPVLSLGDNLCKNVEDNASQGCGYVITIHLDEINNHDVAHDMINSVLLLDDNMRKTVMPFGSPQALVD